MMNLQINDPDKLDNTYNLTSAIEMMKTNHIKYNLHDVFNIVFPDATDPYKVVKIVDLYTNYGSITSSEVAKSNRFYATMLRDPHGSIHENLTVTQEYLINNTDDDLYGVAAVSQVLAIMVEHYELKSEEHNWYLYIDNKTLMDRLDRHRNEQEYSKWNLNPDANVVKYAHKLIKQIPMNIVHVKSHQSSGKDFNKLSLPVQMNTIADNLAEEQQHYNDNLPEVYLPFCYLKIRGKHVTKDSKRTLLEEASMIPVRQYYKDKYGWNTEIFYAINWELQQKVLNTYPTNNQRRILKMVHGWLPTYDHLQRENRVTSMRCPLCHYRTKTSLHVFTCKHTQQSETYNQIGLYLDKDGRETGNRDINKIIKEALVNASNLKLWSANLTGNRKVN
jgi:hypothetical protein